VGDYAADAYVIKDMHRREHRYFEREQDYKMARDQRYALGRVLQKVG